MSHIRSVLALLPVALALAACGQTSTPTTTPTSKELVTVTLKSPFGQKVTAQGLPGLNGNPIVNFFKVKVYKDGETTPLKFKKQGGLYVYDDSGSDRLEFWLNNGDWTSGLSILVPQGKYDIETIGKKRFDDESIFLAYGTNDDVNLTGPTPSVNLTVHTLADEDNTEFYWRKPASVVTMNQDLETRLKVKTPDLEAVSITIDQPDNAPVPTSDFAVTYSFDDTIGGTLVSGNQLGSKVKTPEELTTVYPDQTKFIVNANVSAWVATGDEKAEYQENAFTKKVNVEFADESTVETGDLTPPTVSISEDVDQFDGSHWPIIHGSVSDKHLSKIEIYDGFTLIGSTDGEDAGEGVSQVDVEYDEETGQPIGWHMERRFQSPNDYNITVIATDESDNEARAQAWFSSDELLPHLTPGEGPEFGMGFYNCGSCWGGNPSEAWFLLDMSDYAWSNYTFELHNGPFDGWFLTQMVFNVTAHSSINGPEIDMDTSGDPGFPHYSRSYTGYGEETNNHKFYLHITGKPGSSGWGFIETRSNMLTSQGR